jgi:hypothetical protein
MVTLHGLAKELRNGDILLTEENIRWSIEHVEHVPDGVRLRFRDTEFPWLYAGNERVRFLRLEPTP